MPLEVISKIQNSKEELQEIKKKFNFTSII